MTIVGPLVIITYKSLSKIEKSRLWVIILIMIFVIFFWMCFEQAGVSLTFFAEEQTNRHIFGWEMPASYFQSFNAGFIIILAPIISAIWVRSREERVSMYQRHLKQSLGLAFLASGFLFIAFGSNAIPKEGASIMFLTGCYFLHTVGELCLSPIGLSMVNKLTPGRFTSLMMGIWFLAIATGNKLAGFMSSLYPDPTNPGHPHLFSLEIDSLHAYFMIFVGFSGTAAVIAVLAQQEIAENDAWYFVVNNQLVNIETQQASACCVFLVKKRVKSKINFHFLHYYFYFVSLILTFYGIRTGNGNYAHPTRRVRQTKNLRDIPVVYGCSSAQNYGSVSATTLWWAFSFCI